MEVKLDEDFLFYLGFASTYGQKVNETDKANAKLWLQKLCGEQFTTIQQKRNRNIFLSNLLLDIQERSLSGPFKVNPEDIDLNDPAKYFPAVAIEVTKPEWLKDIVDNAPKVVEEDGRYDGRTYVATRALPGGQGAFAYVAVNMNDDPETMWLGGGEGVFDKVMEEKFREYVPAQTEMEEILARRHDPAERQRVITFFEVILQNIADELDGKIPMEQNTEVNGLMDQFTNEMIRTGEYAQYQHLSPRERRMEMLLLLFDRTMARKNATLKREEVLDNIKTNMNASFFEGPMSFDEDKYELPSVMWEYCINRPPNRKHLSELRDTYPMFVVEKFLALLSNMKEETAIRMQRRHVSIITQMKRELKVEGEKFKKKVNEMQEYMEKMERVAKAVSDAQARQQKTFDDLKKLQRGGETEKTKLYEEMINTLKETQFGVEQEAARGQFLADQINVVNMQAEIYNQVTESTILNTEKENMEIIKNVKRLSAAVKQYENRLEQIQHMKEAKADTVHTMLIF